MIHLNAGKPTSTLPPPERFLVTRDAVLAQVITAQPERWPLEPTEHPIWGLLRIVIAQQVSTRMACKMVGRVRSSFPQLVSGSIRTSPDVAYLRRIGLPQRRAQCCVDVLQRSE